MVIVVDQRTTYTRNARTEVGAKLPVGIAADTHERIDAVRALAFEIAGLTGNPDGIPDPEEWELAAMLCDWPKPDEATKLAHRTSMDSSNFKLVTSPWSPEPNCIS